MRIIPGFILVWTISLSCYADSKWVPNFFVPEEVQTILQLFYSRLPPTKIGSDHRFGVGFRVGKNADAQILVELGPQSETQPLGDPGNGFSKRESRRSEYTRNNLNSADTRKSHINKINRKRNFTKTENEKKVIQMSNITENNNGSNSRRSQDPFQLFGDIFMRWFRWLVQPRQSRSQNIAQEKRENNINKIPRGDTNVTDNNKGNHTSQIVI